MKEVQIELKPQLVAMMDRKVASLKAWMEVWYNEVHEETTSTLQEIQNQVVAIRQNQKKMWRASDGMSKEP